MCFCELIGIPMGSDPGLFMGNLFLYFLCEEVASSNKTNETCKRLEWFKWF